MAVFVIVAVLLNCFIAYPSVTNTTSGVSTALSYSGFKKLNLGANRCAICQKCCSAMGACNNRMLGQQCDLLDVLQYSGSLAWLLRETAVHARCMLLNACLVQCAVLQPVFVLVVRLWADDSC